MTSATRTPLKKCAWLRVHRQRGGGLGMRLELIRSLTEHSWRLPDQIDDLAVFRLPLSRPVALSSASISFFSLSQSNSVPIWRVAYPTRGVRIYAS